MADSNEESKNYAWVKDTKGNEFLCPADAVVKSDDSIEAELKDCIDVEALRPYLEE